MITIRPVQAQDADALFPLVYNTSVTDMLIWDGPQSLEDLRSSLANSAERVARGEFLRLHHLEDFFQPPHRFVLHPA